MFQTFGMRLIEEPVPIPVSEVHGTTSTEKASFSPRLPWLSEQMEGMPLSAQVKASRIDRLRHVSDSVVVSLPSPTSAASREITPTPPAKGAGNGDRLDPQARAESSPESRYTPTDDGRVTSESPLHSVSDGAECLEKGQEKGQEIADSESPSTELRGAIRDLRHRLNFVLSTSHRDEVSSPSSQQLRCTIGRNSLSYSPSSAQGTATVRVGAYQDSQPMRRCISEKSVIPTKIFAADIVDISAKRLELMQRPQMHRARSEPASFDENISVITTLPLAKAGRSNVALHLPSGVSASGQSAGRKRQERAENGNGSEDGYGSDLDRPPGGKRRKVDDPPAREKRERFPCIFHVGEPERFERHYQKYEHISQLM